MTMISNNIHVAATTREEADLTAEQSLALGDSYYVEEDYEQALDAYAVTIAMLCPSSNSQPESSSMVLLLVRSLSHKAATLVQLKRYEEAVTDCQTALVTTTSTTTAITGGDGSGGSGRNTQACYHCLGMALLGLERSSEARAAFVQAAQLALLNGRDATKHERYANACTCTIHVDSNEELTPISLVINTDKTTEAQEDNDDDNDKLLVEEIERKAPPLPATTTTTTTTTATSIRQPPPTMPKYQYYQNDSFMKIEILEPNLEPSLVNVTFKSKKLTVIVAKRGTNFTVICGRLFDKVNVDKCKVTYKPDKVLIKLRKTAPHEWHELFSKALNANDDDSDDDDDKKANAASSTARTTDTGSIAEDPNNGGMIPTVQSGTLRPYASHRDWNAIERDLESAEKAEKPAGDDAMNALFQQIYAKADDDTKRAMIKSYQTSGGTVLSTNWKEVAEKNYEEELQAPKGMEWKTWEGDKVKNQKGDGGSDSGDKANKAKK